MLTKQDTMVQYWPDRMLCQCWYTLSSGEGTQAMMDSFNQFHVCWVGFSYFLYVSPCTEPGPSMWRCSVLSIRLSAHNNRIWMSGQWS